jgi:hypothetical protein
MRIAWVCGVSLFHILALAPSLEAQAPESVGALWAQMEEGSKLFYMSGLSDMAVWVKNVADFSSGKAARTYAANPRYAALATLSPSQRMALHHLVRDLVSEGALSHDDIRPVVGVMDRLYSEPANAKVPWFLMAAVAAARLNGASADSIESRLERLRATAASK